MQDERIRLVNLPQMFQLLKVQKVRLILKLLKPTIVNPKNKTWDLMMKNVYSIGAYQVSQADFIMDIWYNNPMSSTDINYLPYEGVDNKLLMQQLDLDQTQFE
jgi:cell surface protein SprA